MKGWVFAVFNRVRQAVCALRGHDALLWFEADRLSLRCGACGWNSPGWTIAAARRPLLRAPSRLIVRRSSPPPIGRTKQAA